MDPQGRLFHYRGEILRGLFPDKAAALLDFLDSPLYAAWVKEGIFVETSTSNYRMVGFESILRHRRIRFPSYSFEWTPEMLRDAGLLTLRLNQELLEQDATLQDATPANVLFDGARPIFVDAGSIVNLNRRFLWLPYQQFCQFFYYPSLLNAAGFGNISRRLLADDLNGVQANDVVRLLPVSHKLTAPGYFLRVSATYHSSRLVNYLGREGNLRRWSERAEGQIPDRTRARFLRKIEAVVSRVRFRENSDWEKYYDQTERANLKRKQQLVQSVLGNLKPATVLDVGANTGEFSRMAARAGARVVSIDTDEACMSRLYRHARNERLLITPLVMNVLSPTPDFGWCGRQFVRASDRFRSELVLALALMHHLIYTGGQDFDRIIATIKSFQERYALYEYVDRTDPLAHRLRRRIGFTDDWYNLDSFLGRLNAHYSSVEIVGSISQARCIILCES